MLCEHTAFSFTIENIVNFLQMNGGFYEIQFTGGFTGSDFRGSQAAYQYPY